MRAPKFLFQKMDTTNNGCIASKEVDAGPCCRCDKSDMPNEYVSEGVREVVGYRNVLDIICICYFARQRFAIAISATF